MSVYLTYLMTFNDCDQCVFQVHHVIEPETITV